VLFQDAETDWSKLPLSDPENWSQVAFDLRVVAYSDIGPGAIFSANLGDGSFAPKQAPPKGSEGSRNEDSVDSDDESQESEDPSEIARHRWSLLHDESDSESIEDESDDELDDDEGLTQEGLEDGHVWNEDPSKPFTAPTPLEYYSPTAMVTGVHVTLHQPYGRIEGAKAVLKKACGSQADGEANGENTSVIAKSVVAEAIAMAKAAITSGAANIRKAKDDMEEYNLASDWEVTDDELFRPQGWARRPSREDGMYGKLYITDQYREELQHMFDEGAQNSSSKRGPAEMREQLEIKFPGYYCYPGEIEISKAISAMFDRQKKAGTSSKREKKLPDVIEAKIRELMDRHPDKKGSFIENLVRPCFNEQNLPPAYVYNRKHVMEKVNAWNQQARNKKDMETNRLLIG
jgi:hypothetical protein